MSDHSPLWNMTIYTIGYQRMTPSELLTVAERLGAIVIDVRSKRSSRKPGFGGLQLQELLGDRYQAMGQMLGGRTPIDPAGIRLLAENFSDDTADAGVGRKRTRSAPHAHCLLMCLEHDPWDCHRHTQITARHFPGALHVIDRMFYTSADIQKKIADPRHWMQTAGEVIP